MACGHCGTFMHAEAGHMQKCSPRRCPVTLIMFERYCPMPGCGTRTDDAVQVPSLPVTGQCSRFVCQCDRFPLKT